VFIARRNNRSSKAAQLRKYIRNTSFNEEWRESVPGLGDHIVKVDGGTSFRFSPAHNDIVARIVADVLQ